MEARVVRSNCGMCHSGCGILAHVEDGKLVKIEGDPDCPYNKGALCAKGLAGRQLVHSPDRLQYPMKRVGERGEGKWQRISWDEALDTVAQRITEIRDNDGPFAVAVASGTARPLFPWVRRFLNILGNHIVKKIIDSIHGGTIEITSPGRKKGTTVTIFLSKT